MTDRAIYIGLMSGTSLDGLDLVAATFEPELRLLAAETVTLPNELKRNLLQLTQPGNNEIDLMGVTEYQLGHFLAASVNQLISRAGLSRDDIRAIGSHGQTIRHRPELNFTLQIGDPSLIAELTGITTVADFRRRDLAAGGQGAPLVPAFHQAILQTNHDRVLLNIGGMANLTYLPATSKQSEQPVLGFDTGPGNVLMDAWIQKHQQRNYDDNGAWASSGTPDQTLLAQLQQTPYFSEPPPKSTGRELFNLNWLEQQPGIDKLAAEDIQATLLELTAWSIADCVSGLLPDQQLELLVCGGGSHNQALLTRLAELLPQATLGTTTNAGIDPDWMEALAFAWLAKQCMDGKPGNLSSVTGARGQRILGAIYPA